MPEEFGLSGVYLVTGGTRGIGRAISTRFARAGGRVIANYVRNERAAVEFRSSAAAQHLAIDLCRADLTTSEGLDRVEAAVTREDRQLAGLVHCAATGTHRALDSLTPRHLEWTLALNVEALFALVKRLLPRLDRASSVLAVSSLGATRAFPLYTAIGTSKGALEALIRHLALELGPRGIRANVLTPGAVATDAWNAVPDREARLAEAAHQSPIGRLVTAEEVAAGAQFLCSPAASGINGQTLIVDGGTSIVSGQLRNS